MPPNRATLAEALAQLSKHEADAGKEKFRPRVFAALEQALADGLEDPLRFAAKSTQTPLRDDERLDELAQSLALQH